MRVEVWDVVNWVVTNFDQYSVINFNWPSRLFFPSRSGLLWTFPWLYSCFWNVRLANFTFSVPLAWQHIFLFHSAMPLTYPYIFGLLIFNAHLGKTPWKCPKHLKKRGFLLLNFAFTSRYAAAQASPARQWLPGGLQHVCPQLGPFPGAPLCIRGLRN